MDQLARRALSHLLVLTVVLSLGLAFIAIRLRMARASQPVPPSLIQEVLWAASLRQRALQAAIERSVQERAVTPLTSLWRRHPYELLPLLRLLLQAVDVPTKDTRTVAQTAAVLERLAPRLGLPPRPLENRLLEALLVKASYQSPGKRGPLPHALNILLNRLGLPASPKDDSFDSRTAQALRAFACRTRLPFPGHLTPALAWALLTTPAVTAGYPCTSPGWQSLAYLTEWPGSGANTSLFEHYRYFTEIAPLWFRIAADGSLRLFPYVTPSRIRATVSFAHAHGLQVLALVVNAGGNDAILQDPATRQIAVDRLVSAIRQYHLDGVNIDFEGIDGYDAPGLTRFVAMTAARLRPLGLRTTVAVGARAETEIPLGDASAAYDYRALGQVTDQVVLMTYDEHDDGSPPGPIAGILWVRRILTYALRMIPPTKILLGVADYGYDWSSSGTVSLQAGQCEALARAEGAAVRWDSQAEEPYFLYRRGGQAHIVFFEDGASLALRLALARQDHLGGVALWSLGDEGSGFFTPWINTRGLQP